MAALAYTLGKREINYYFSVRSAKALALGAVLVLTACHAASRRYRGEGAAAGAPRGAAAGGQREAEPRRSPGTAAGQGERRCPRPEQPWRGREGRRAYPCPGGLRRRGPRGAAGSRLLREASRGTAAAGPGPGIAADFPAAGPGPGLGVCGAAVFLP